MILFATLKKFIFLGGWALHKMSNIFDTSSSVNSFTVQMYSLDI